ncbi:caspase family protein [Streptomyces sp. NPDC056909]|uniref:caspase family protein n=1 Tax=Streptomyces sp. NPDC056909 TaxID=3345963 RepID=UPI003676A6FD
MGSFDDGVDWDDLGFVRTRVDDIKAAFERFGAKVEDHVDPTEEETEALLRSWIISPRRPDADVVVVHLIGHGHTDRAGRLLFIPRDGREVDLDRWIATAQREADRGAHAQRVVFLVDTCDAGTATGRQSLTDLGTERGVWSLGAAVSGSPTERGRFSGWIATGLLRLWDKDFALEADSLDFAEFVREVLQVVRAESDWRVSAGFSVEQGDGEWPFLPNPQTMRLSQQQIEEKRGSFWYVTGQDLGTQIAAGEEIGDADYFLDRASGRGLIPVGRTSGFFSGQAEPLAAFRKWLADDSSPLLIVTGAAGSGKSGLLGLVVCAAHPQLRQRFRQVWEKPGGDLPESADIIALHARQRTARQVTEMIVSQAALAPPASDEQEEDTGNDDREERNRPSGTRWTSAKLRTALAEEGKRRLIVIDAVDESTQPDAVMELIATLVTPSGDDEHPAPPCRVLIGSRGEAVEALPIAAEDPSPAVLLDLDQAEHTVVERDIRQYIVALLRASEPYATGAAAAYVDTIATIAARRITGQRPPGASWGPFLLAGMFVHYLVTLATPPQNKADAEAHASRAAGDLPTILEAVLTARGEDFPLLRPVLAALARSKGDGMPLTVLRRCVEAFRDGAPGTGTDADFAKTLREASPFLRTARDPSSKVALYRLFHQGLTDYLRAHPRTGLELVAAAESTALEGKVLDAVVAPYTGAAEGEDLWAEAEPYVLRHALEHVMEAEAPQHAEEFLTDPYFLVRFDPRQDLRALDLTDSARAAEYRRLLAMSWAAHTHFTAAADRAAVLAYDAHRLNLPERQVEFAAVGRSPSVDRHSAGHPVIWARGGRVDTTARLIEGTGGTVHHVAFSPDGELLAAATNQGVEIRDTKAWRLVTRHFGNTENWVSAVAFSPDGKRLAFNTAEEGQCLRLWDVAERALLGEAWPAHGKRVNSVAFSPDGRLLAAGSDDGRISVWDVGSAPPVEIARLEHGKEVQNVLFSPDGRLMASAGHNGLALWGTDDWRNRKWLTAKWTSGAAFSPDGSLLVALDSSGDVEWWSCTTEELVHTVPTGNVAVFGALAFSPDGTRLVAGASGMSSSLVVIDVTSREVVRRLQGHGSYIRSVTFHPASPLQFVSCGELSGGLRLWKGFEQDPATEPLAQYDRKLIACSPDGRLLAVADNDERVLALYDPAGGEALPGVPLGRHKVAQVLEFSPGSDLLAMLSEKETLLVVRTGALTPPVIETISIGGSQGVVQDCAFSPDGGLIALVITQGRGRLNRKASVIKVWETRRLRLTGRIPLPGQPDAFCFTGPGRLFVSLDGAMAVYDCSGPDEEPV